MSNMNNSQDFIVKSLLSTPISEIAGIGPKRATLYKKLGVACARDLLMLMPNRIIKRKINPRIHDIAPGDSICKLVKIISFDLAPSAKSSRPSKIICDADGESVELLYFHTPSKLITSRYPLGQELMVSGEGSVSYGTLTIIHPDNVVPANESYKIPEFEPVYPATKGLNSKFIALTIKNILRKLPEIKEWLPQDLIASKQWPSIRNAFEIIHNPKNMNDVHAAKSARDRLAFDEILAHQLKLKKLKEKAKSFIRQPLDFSGGLKNKMLAQLPFQLTSSQINTISEIEEDLKSENRVTRLIQGDVGSGKTLVALSLLLNYVEAGAQGVLMVPTEILALQHTKTISNLVEPLGIECRILLGTMKAAEKREATQAIESGKAQIIIGTHALFQEQVTYHNLRMVIIDEQHRFGVEQRRQLVTKGDKVDFIMMSATPIPRTLELTNYGDMDISIIREKPANRLEIVTSIISHSKIDDIENSLASRIEKGEKVYWVCPLIEATEKLDLAHCETRFESLQEKFPGKVGLIHGRIKQEDREIVMQKFINGEYKIIVATTVIEVGVDVKDATIMIIENAERFGLSQLHQLRGRVGRGDKQSYCILIYGKNYGKTSQQRLNVMKSSSDGFFIAEEDLKLRGPGDIVGKKQSGLPDFKIFDYETDRELLEIAFHTANHKA
ncbi:MAG: ATP-dependent helicase RecG [Candidatus Midichloriaceae bacterium]|jgi:ATP-dependent DNA helicase RecG|nr:ATP-dependent helicase RecG [Candidatus Midichloriaceae bacterium]